MSGKMKTMDGNAAAALDLLCLYRGRGDLPHNPSTPMAENVDEWAAQGKKNLLASRCA